MNPDEHDLEVQVGIDLQEENEDLRAQLTAAQGHVQSLEAEVERLGVLRTLAEWIVHFDEPTAAGHPRTVTLEQIIEQARAALDTTNERTTS